MKDNTSNINKQRYEAEVPPVEVPQTKNDKFNRIADRAVGAAAVAGGALSAWTSTIPFIASKRVIEREKAGLAKPGSSRFLKVLGAGLIASGAASAYLGAHVLRRKD